MTAGQQRGEDQAEVAGTMVVRTGGKGTVLVAVQKAAAHKEDEDRVVVADRVVAQTVAARREAAYRVVGSGYSSCVMHSSRC